MSRRGTGTPIGTRSYEGALRRLKARNRQKRRKHYLLSLRRESPCWSSLRASAERAIPDHRYSPMLLRTMGEHKKASGFEPDAFLCAAPAGPLHTREALN